MTPAESCARMGLKHPYINRKFSRLCCILQQWQVKTHVSRRRTGISKKLGFQIPMTVMWHLNDRQDHSGRGKMAHLNTSSSGAMLCLQTSCQAVLKWHSDMIVSNTSEPQGVASCPWPLSTFGDARRLSLSNPTKSIS